MWKLCANVKPRQRTQPNETVMEKGRCEKNGAKENVKYVRIKWQREINLLLSFYVHFDTMNQAHHSSSIDHYFSFDLISADDIATMKKKMKNSSSQLIYIYGKIYSFCAV